MNLSLILFLIGILGFVLNRKNIILMLISIEIMLLAITFLILISSLSFDDILGQTYAIYIIAIAGAESAIGLGILVAFYRLNSSLITFCLTHSNTTYIKKVKYSPEKKYVILQWLIINLLAYLNILQSILDLYLVFSMLKVFFFLFSVSKKKL